MNILKSIGAILVGLIFIGISHSVVDFILESLGIFTPPTQRFDTPWMLWTAIAYRAVLSVVGCYVTARLAPSGPMRHALILGAIGVVLSTIGVFVNMQMNLGANWYPIALVIISLPCAWLGGRLAVR